MSLPKNRSQMSFFYAQVLLTDNFFSKDQPYPFFRKKILPALKRAHKTFDPLYCADNGRPAVNPVMVPTGCSAYTRDLLQTFLDNLIRHFPPTIHPDECPP